MTLKLLAPAALALTLLVPASSRIAAHAQTTPAQASNTCTLLTTDDVKVLVPEEHEHVNNVVPVGAASLDGQSCRYTWGEGTGHYSFAVSVNPASRMFVGQNPDAIKLALLTSVKAESSDAIISDVGDAAVFKTHTSAYVSATAYLKDHILNVSLDGFDAVNSRDTLVSLLKKAAAKL